jgi:8-oxo-dGTP pyrophosphatase MutT (NUDIX family)
MKPSVKQATSNTHPLFLARTLIFIRNNNHFLFIKGSPNKHTWPNLYNAIGGHIEKNESVIAAAFRELLEETGLANQDIQSLHLVGTITISLPDESPNILILIFLGTTTTTNVKESIEGSLHWLTPEEITESPTVEDIPLLLEQILKRNNAKHPFSWHYWYDANNQLQIETS